MFCGAPATIASHRDPVALGGAEMTDQVDACCADCHPRAERAAVRRALRRFVRA